MSQVNADFVAPPRILVVDDNPDTVDLVSRYLSWQGMVAVPAYSGQQCLEQVRQGAVDVIVLDVMMPGMDGLEVCAALQQMASARATSIILLTACDDRETRLAGIKLGVSDFLRKNSEHWHTLQCNHSGMSF
ncbi:MAG: response regulator [Deltaproteobacteria bacterium]|nr:response regulator [Deltaproteobacteria bacterium]